MSSEFVIAVYRPKSGKEKELLVLLGLHQKTLVTEGLANRQNSLVMRSSADGSYIEIFEWVSADAAQSAHARPGVMKIWTAMSNCADMIALSEVACANEVFPHFQAVEL